MKARSQLRRRSEANTRTATLSAWVMSIVFGGIAVISFAVDQTVMMSVAFGEAGSEASPLRLIESLIGRAADHSDHAR